MVKGFDFSGWATRANMRCSDGRVIMKDAFKDCDGATVPLVWGHKHDSTSTVIGHALLENREEGVYAYGFLNSTQSGKEAKILVEHGDVSAMSIYANHLKEQAGNVIHGIIREVSLVLAGANPGALIDSVIVHSDGSVTEDREQGVLYTGEIIELCHADEEDKEEDNSGGESKEEKKEDKDDGEDETAQAIYDSLTPKQKVVVEGIFEAAIDDLMKEKEDNPDKNEEDKNSMKHNIFDQETKSPETYLSHEEGVQIINQAKSFGGRSLKAELAAYVAENKKELAHADLGFNNISTLFPEYEDVKPGAPDTITSDQGWVTEVINGVHKSPMSRLRTRHVDARDISNRRAQGYKKGTQKTDAGNLDVTSRTTDPITVYIRSKLDRDDIVDITDFDVVAYMYENDKRNLYEELARQIMIGDGRSGDKAIDPTKIRPIWLDEETYTIHKDVDIDKMKTTLNGSNTAANFGENYIYAEAVIESLLYARENYRGSGNPVFFCTPHLVNVMLLARDLNGRRVYDNITELTAALNVRKIVTAEQFEGQTRTASGEKTKKLLGIMVNLSDYYTGYTKGGQLTHFTDFDINFNQEVSLLETRLSGANTRLFSAIALEEDVTGK